MNWKKCKVKCILLPLQTDCLANFETFISRQRQTAAIAHWNWNALAALRSELVLSCARRIRNET